MDGKGYKDGKDMPILTDDFPSFQGYENAFPHFPPVDYFVPNRRSALYRLFEELVDMPQDWGSFCEEIRSNILNREIHNVLEVHAMGRLFEYLAAIYLQKLYQKSRLTIIPPQRVDHVYNCLHGRLSSTKPHPDGLIGTLSTKGVFTITGFIETKSGEIYHLRDSQQLNKYLNRDLWVQDLLLNRQDLVTGAFNSACPGIDCTRVKLHRRIDVLYAIRRDSKIPIPEIPNVLTLEIPIDADELSHTAQAALQYVFPYCIDTEEERVG